MAISLETILALKGRWRCLKYSGNQAKLPLQMRDLEQNTRMEKIDEEQTDDCKGKWRKQSRQKNSPWRHDKRNNTALNEAFIPQAAILITLAIDIQSWSHEYWRIRLIIQLKVNDSDE